MNTLPLTRHLLLKDLRRERAWLAALWGLALALPFIAERGHAVFQAYSNFIPPVSQYAPFHYATWGFFALIIIAVARVIRLDAPGREFHFLATRPVPQGVLLASKALFIILFLLVPVWVARLGMPWRVGVPMERMDVALVLVETTIQIGAALAAAMLVSLFVRYQAAILAVMVAGAVGVSIAGEYLERHWYFQNPIWKIDMGVIASRFLVFYICVIMTVVAVAVLRFRRASAAVLAVVLAAGVVLGGVAWKCWPYDLSTPFSGLAAKQKPLPAELREGISLTLTGTEGKDNNIVQESGEMNGEISYFFNHDVSLKGVEAPYFAELAGYHAVATLKSGRTIVSDYDDVNGHGGWGGMSDALRATMAGAMPREKVHWDQNHFEIFNYFPKRYANEDLTGVNVKGTITLLIYKAVLLKTAPFRAGEWVDLPRRHYVIRRVESTRDGLGYDMTMTGIRSTLRADASGLDGQETFSLLAFNPGRSEFLASFGSGGASAGPGYFLRDDHMNESLREIVNTRSLEQDWRDSEQGKFPADWGDGAQVAFFTAMPCGRVTLPYEIASKDLRH